MSGLDRGGGGPASAADSGWQRLPERADSQGSCSFSPLAGGTQWLRSAPGRAQDVRSSDSVREEMRSVLQPLWCREIAVAALLRCAVTMCIALLYVLPSLATPAPAGTGLLLSLDVAILGLALAQRCGVAIPSFKVALFLSQANQVSLGTPGAPHAPPSAALRPAHLARRRAQALEVFAATLCVLRAAAMGQPAPGGGGAAASTAAMWTGPLPSPPSPPAPLPALAAPPARRAGASPPPPASPGARCR